MKEKAKAKGNRKNSLSSRPGVFLNEWEKSEESIHVLLKKMGFSERCWRQWMGDADNVKRYEEILFAKEMLARGMEVRAKLLEAQRKCDRLDSARIVAEGATGEPGEGDVEEKGAEDELGGANPDTLLELARLKGDLPS